MRVELNLPETLLMSYLQKAQEAHQKNDRAGATKFYTLALRIDPDCVGALNNLGMILAEDNHFLAAGTCTRRAVRQNPQDVYIRANYGAISIRNGFYDEAIRTFGELTTRCPNEHGFWRDYAIAVLASDPHCAVEYLERARSIAPNDPHILRDLGLAKLTVRDWDVGFEMWRRSGLDSVDDAAFSVLPTWKGEDLADKTIVVYHEQGLGDTIQFCRFLHLLEAKRVILAVPSPLVRLLRMSFVETNVEVIDFADPAPLDADCQIPLMFTWAHRSISRAMENLDEPYLKVPANGPRVHRGENTLLMVGICWKGNPLYGNDPQRSMPFELLLPLADVPGVQLVSLQKGSASMDVYASGAGALVQDPSGQIGDLADVAHVVKRLDLVVTVDTAVLHLAGALGVPTLAMLPYNRCWRWSRDTNTTPFYRSVKLLTQCTLGDWSAVIQGVRTEIDRMIGGREVTPEPQQFFDRLDVPTFEF